MRSVMQSVWEEMGGISKSTLFFWERMSYSGKKSGISYQKRHPVRRQSPICGRRVVFLWEDVLFLVASAKFGLVLWYFGEKTCGSCKKMGISGRKSPIFGRKGQLSNWNVVFLWENDLLVGEKGEILGRNVFYLRATVFFLECKPVLWGANRVYMGENVLFRSVK